MQKTVTPPTVAPMNDLVGQFSAFRVVSITPIGAFLDWGEPKDLFLPQSEQLEKINVGDTVAVFIYLDKQERPCATMRLERFTSDDMPTFKPEAQVELMIYHETELGYKALVDQKYLGLLYKNEVFKPLSLGDELIGYVKKVRDDRKIDLNLRPAGHGANKDIAENILSLLRENDGFLALDDKTPPEKIYELFGVSKKKYKVALGQLYKGRKIKIEDGGIRLV